MPVSGIPDELRAKQGFNVLQQEFHLGLDAPAIVVIDGDINNSATRSAMTALQDKAASDAAFTPSRVAAYPEKNLAVVYIGLGETLE
jgi:RND superfamily putative drug exporter